VLIPASSSVDYCWNRWAAKLIFHLHSTTILTKQLFFPFISTVFNVYHFKNCELWHFVSFCYGECSKWPYSAKFVAASVSEMDCIPAVHCGWTYRIVAYIEFMVLSVHFEHWLLCRLVNDFYHCFSTMNIVGLFGFWKLWKVSCLIKITVEYCLKISLYTSQGSAATIYRWDGQVYNFLCWISLGCRLPKIIKISWFWVIPKIRNRDWDIRFSYHFETRGVLCRVLLIFLVGTGEDAQWLWSRWWRCHSDICWYWWASLWLRWHHWWMSSRINLWLSNTAVVSWTCLYAAALAWLWVRPSATYHCLLMLFL